jgi:hypothetical protein
MELKLNPIFVPLNVEIGDRSVELVVDLTTDNLLEIGQVCMKSADKMKAVDQLKKKAVESKNVEEAKRANKEMAKVLKDALTQAIGAEKYDELLEAAGNGHEIKPAACNQIMTAVFGAIAEIVAKNNKELTNSKAAHYLSEVANAQPEPNAAE